MQKSYLSLCKAAFLVLPICMTFSFPAQAAEPVPPCKANPTTLFIQDRLDYAEKSRAYSKQLEEEARIYQERTQEYTARLNREGEEYRDESDKTAANYLAAGQQYLTESLATEARYNEQGQKHQASMDTAKARYLAEGCDLSGWHDPVTNASAE